MRGETLETRMRQAAGSPGGFDYLRLVLSIGVLVFHSVYSSYGDDLFLWDFPFRGVIAMLLPLFFGLSGFLVAGSLVRSKTIGEFILARVFRIFPALLVDTVFSAVVLGAALTSLGLAAYFESAGFRVYFLNIVGSIHFYLPGVYETNPITVVNQSLWTIPYELECYVMLVVLAVARIVRVRVLLLAIVVALTLALYAHNVLWKHLFIDRVEPKFLDLTFLYGVCLYYFRERVPTGRVVACVVFVMAYAMLSTYGLFYYLAPAPVAYVAAWLGTLDPKRLWIVRSGDYSYGLYLYAFPFQQLYVYLFPAHRFWLWNSVFALAVCSVFAFLSWHLVEKPFGRLRKGSVMRRLTGAKPNPSPHGFDSLAAASPSRTAAPPA